VAAKAHLTELHPPTRPRALSHVDALDDAETRSAVAFRFQVLPRTAHGSNVHVSRVKLPNADREDTRFQAVSKPVCDLSLGKTRETRLQARTARSVAAPSPPQEHRGRAPRSTPAGCPGLRPVTATPGHGKTRLRGHVERVVRRRFSRTTGADADPRQRRPPAIPLCPRLRLQD
jgi:hypothetical protein